LGDKDNKFKHLILSKPIQEAGEKLGFLPGDEQEKIAPHMESYIDNLKKLLGDHESQWKWMMDDGTIKFTPLAYLRGRTFDNSIIILDEAQNADMRQLMLVVTRMAKTSKVIICGDVSQYDIQRSKVALPDFTKMIEGVKGVGKFLFDKEDIVRDKILIEITDRYEKWKEEQNID
jgi:phosphate starvation-inducible PhoH-like protein